MTQVIPAKSVKNKALSRIKGKGRGWVFTPVHFLDLGPRKSVDMALARLSDSGAIRRLARGLYDFPKKHPKLGLIVPSPDTIAKALSDRDDSRLLPSGAYAANLLGLSPQVPAHVVYRTDAATRTVAIGKQKIHLLRSTPRTMATAGRISGLVIQALRYIGAGKITDQQLVTLQRNLSDGDRAQVWKDHVYAPVWMHQVLYRISHPDAL